MLSACAALYNVLNHAGRCHTSYLTTVCHADQQTRVRKAGVGYYFSKFTVTICNGFESVFWGILIYIIILSLVLFHDHRRTPKSDVKNVNITVGYVIKDLR